MPIQKSSTQLIVIGAGPGGYAAAFRAADAGLQVTLVDDGPNPGGVCLYRGCIPSKALLHAAHVLEQAESAKNFGIQFGAPQIDSARLTAWKNEVVAKLTGGLGALVKQRKIRFVQGRANFLDAHTIRVYLQNAAEEDITFEHAILATGSRPASIPDWPLDSPHLLNSTAALEIPFIPKSLLVIGGGYIGLELGTVYAALGTEVHVIEMTAGLLPQVDRDLVLPLQRQLEKKFKSIHLSSKVEKISENAGGLTVTYSDATGKHQISVEKVLVSVGRKPNTSGMGLKETQIQVDEKGFIVVDAERRTAEAHIFAIGDITGEPMLAHKASHEAHVAVENILDRAATFEPKVIPAVVFTDPEIAWCGLTEMEAKQKGIQVEVARFPWAASGRSLTLGRSEGITKLLIDPDTEQILGVGLVGPGAGELIAEAALAIEMGTTATDLKLVIHAHPTLSETLMEAAEVFFGESVHLYRPRKRVLA